MDKKTRDHDSMMQGLNWWGSQLCFVVHITLIQKDAILLWLEFRTVQETEPQNVISIWPPGL